MEDAPSAFQFVSRLRKSIKTPPEQTVGGDYDSSKSNRTDQKKIEVLGLGCRGDHGSDPNRRIRLSFTPEIFGDDAGVPRAARGRDHARNKKRKNSRENQFAPSLPSANAKNVGGFF